MSRLLTFRFTILAALLAAGLSAPGIAAAPAAGEPAQDEASSSASLPALDLTPDLMQLLLVGDIAAQRGDGVLAAQLWNELSKRAPDPRLAARATELSLNSGQLAIALESAERWISIDPASPRAQQIIIGLLIRANRINDATPYLQQVIAKNPAEAPGFFRQLHLLWGKASDRSAVLHTTRELARQYPELPEAHFATAYALATAGQNSEAISELDLALQLRPNWEPAAIYKAQLLAGNDPQASLAILKDASAANPMSSALLLSQARLQAEQGQIAAAHDTYQHALKMQPDNPEALTGTAVTAIELRNFDEAKSLLERLLQLKPDEPSLFYLYLGQIAEEQRDWAAALDAYGKVTERQYLERVREREPRLLARNGQRDAALQAAAALPEGNEEEAVTKAQVQALVWKELGELAQARALLSAALSKYPNNPDLYYDRSIYADEAGDIAAAERDLRKNLALSPDNPAGLNALGYLLTNRTERLEEAQLLLEKALTLEPDNPALQDSIGWLRFRQGRYTEALEWLQKAWSASKEPEIGLHLAETLAKLERRKDARDLLAEVAKRGGKQADIDALRTRLGL
ncbi:tetratricopeptide repeat protein [Chitinilyticum piscinae]|uniref:Tetratricopeptide repeat protein n=1 Tax=Chitinilyticum piscinae TaxID=2866724 RepID=A0A8J7FN60_9NEIS|nr:tetratricopeptide repeat protein [Chitinilyticum piscinae]MBE9609224.1 tetratricopeptide repeat protein [Chitinilyticum piscinae]